MKTIVGCFLGLVALMTFSVGSPVYADEIDAEASALSVLAPDAGANGIDGLDDTHCVLYSDGADNCIVNAQPEVVDEGATTFSEIDSSPTEEAPAIRFLDAVPVAVIQTVTMAAPGADNGDREETPAGRPVLMPAPEGAPDHDDRDAETATGPLVPPVGQSADAIVAAVVQSATIAVPGQSERNSEELPLAELQLAPASISTLEAKTADQSGEE
jgi:hypothetical protein